MKPNYDFIIVGGGSAGSVLASRLSQSPQVSVLLLEAGGSDRHPFYHMPAGFAKMTKGIGSWGWHTVPQKHMNGMSIRFTQAKVIGGGSTINAQIYTRGNPLDYDEWRQHGCTGWGYDDLLPYFRKSEHNDSFQNKFHGTMGPLGVSQPAAPLPICDAYFKAAGQLGIPRNHDFAGESQEGVAPWRKRPNLTIETGAEVHRIVVEKGRARGVKLARHGLITADSEVILSCGAIGSPRLLQLSGIGPADSLRALDIDVALDQPSVGANLQDHLDLFVIAECSGPHTYDRFAKPHLSFIAGLRYLLTRSGPAASSLFETGGFWYVDEEARSPDIQFHLGLGSGIEAGVEAMRNGGVTLNSAYLRPRSRGSVRLASSNPAAPPLIDPNYWQDDHDRQMGIKGLKIARDIMRQDALKPFITAERLPGPDISTDAEYFEYACKHAKTDHHPAGTCRMGIDAEAVVDPRLRFHGIEGLRVVDNSIMPNLISSNTNSTAIMIGEKAADMIMTDKGFST